MCTGRALILAWSLCLLPPSAGAQEVGGCLEGRVVDAKGAPLAGAQATVTGPAIQGSRRAATDRAGRFRIVALPVGVCSLTVSSESPMHVLVSETLDGIAIGLGQTILVGDVQLRTEPIDIPGVTVSAARRPRLDPVSTVIGGRFDVKALRSLPVDRDYQSIVTLLPHANESYALDRANLSGTTGAETKYYVDGASTVEPPGNGQSTSLPYNFLQQIEVRAGGYEAEYGGAGGGLINAVTASGGNEIHGQVFGFYASRLLTSTTGVLSVSEKTNRFESWDAGFTVGGPVRRDRLWYFLAYNPTGERESVHLPGTGSADDRRLAHRFAAKLNWRLDDHTNLVLSGVGDPSERDQVGGVILSRLSSLGNLDPVLADQRGGGGNVSLKATRVLGANEFLDVLVTRSDSRYSLVPRTARGRLEPLYLDARSGYVEGGMGNVVDRWAGRTTAQVQLGMQRGSHFFKAGARYQDEFQGEFYQLEMITRQSDSLYQVTSLTDRRSRCHIRAPGAFVQDSWQATTRLRVHAGLRWEGEYWITSEGDVGQRLMNGWQPRLGMTWMPPASPPLKLFASAGRFQQQTRLNVPQWFYQDLRRTYFIREFDHDPRQDPSGGVVTSALNLGRQAEVEGLRGAAFDEFQLGGEWAPSPAWDVTLRGTLRRQVSAIVGVLDVSILQPVCGNPGHGRLAAYPEIDRQYRALELSVHHAADTFQLRAGYVFSRTRGNYEGYWDQTVAQNDPLGGAAFIPFPSAAPNATGLLPNDRTHVFKLQGSSGSPHRIEAGVTLLWASGTPLGELGSTPYGHPYYIFLSPRGSRGRTPAIYDVNVRLAHEARWLRSGMGVPRLILDAYHLGSPRKPLVIDQLRFRGFDRSTGQQTTPNANYGKPLLTQPGVAYRFGCELRW